RRRSRSDPPFDDGAAGPWEQQELKSAGTLVAAADGTIEAWRDAGTGASRARTRLSTHRARKPAPPGESNSGRDYSPSGSTATDRRYGPARRHALGLVSAAIALFIDDRGRFGLIDRLRQCCQLAVGARDGATERDRRAAGVGRGTFPPRAATAH